MDSDGSWGKVSCDACVENNVYVLCPKKLFVQKRVYLFVIEG